jgi:SAM-dependent methyltransferase
MSRGDWWAANRRLWDEWAEINARSEFYGLEEFKAGKSKLRPFEIEEVGGVRGKDLLHLQCHFGLDTLSWAREGARVTGADFSEVALRIAEDLAHELGLDATWVMSDLYDLPENLDGDFDVVYTSRGVLGWLPDLRRWAEVAAGFLRPGGIFYIHEMHPFLYPFDDSPGAVEPKIAFPYWPRAEPVEFPVHGSYADPEAVTTQRTSYDWPHSMGDVLNSIIEAGLRIEFLHEWPFLDWDLPFLERRGDQWWWPEGKPGEIPLSFSLRARNPSG